MNKPKISVVIPYGTRYDENEIEYFKFLLDDVRQRSFLFTEELRDLYLRYIPDIENVIDMTLFSLENQTFKDFEIVIVAKHKNDFRTQLYHFPNIKIVEDKSTLWHDVGGFALNNARNTGIIHADGELLMFLDPYNIFNENVLQEAWDNYQNGYYITFNQYTRIKHNPSEEEITSWRNRHPNRRIFVNGKWRTMMIRLGGFACKIPQDWTWGYGFTVSLDDAVKINGFSELYDGAKGDDDSEFGNRLDAVTDYGRNSSKNFLYEFIYGDAVAPEYSEHRRDNSLLRREWTLKSMPGIRANETKPSKEFLDRYLKLYRETWNQDPEDDWDKFMDVPLFDIEEKRKERIENENTD